MLWCVWWTAPATTEKLIDGVDSLTWLLNGQRNGILLFREAWWSDGYSLFEGPVSDWISRIPPSPCSCSKLGSGAFGKFVGR